MGLFSTNSTVAQDSANFKQLLNGIGDYLIANDQFNIEKFEFGSRSIDRACLIATEHVFNDRAFPKTPGPFKRAAAAAILTKTVVETNLVANQRVSEEGAYNPRSELNCWKARIAYLTIAPVINASSITIKGGGVIDLSEKLWLPSTNHVKVEMIAFIRWLDNLMTRGETDFLHAGRLCRAVMALALIIEQSYYLVGAKTHCKVMGLTDCVPDAGQIPDGWDLWYDTHHYPKSA